MLRQRLRFYEGLFNAQNLLLAHSHQDAHRSCKRNPKQLARIDPVLVIDAQNSCLLAKSQDDGFGFTPAEAKIRTHRFKRLALALRPTFLNPATPANSTEVSTTPLGPRRDLFLGDNLDLGLEATRATI